MNTIRDKLSENFGLILFSGITMAYILPLIVVWLFDLLYHNIHSLLFYLNPLYLYAMIMSQQKYIVVLCCTEMYVVFLATRKIGILQNHGEHGSERWARDTEVSRIFNMRKLTDTGLKKQNQNCGGLVIKKVGKKIWHEMAALHSLVIGTTSSGKTRKTLIPSIMIATEAVCSHNYKERIIIKNQKKFEKYKKRKEFIEDFCIFGIYPLESILAIIRHLIKFRKTKVFKIDDIYDIKSYYHYDDMDDIDMSIKCKSKHIRIDREGLIKMLTPGRCRIDINIAINGESFFVNDPKRELYARFKKYLERKGYQVILLDLRNNDQGDCWNPIATVVRLLKEGKRDEADLYANDIAAALCPESKMSEKIWTDGERAIIASVILAVADADCDEAMKNMYSCYQILLTLGHPKEDETVPLNNYLNSLPIGHIARTAFGPAALATDRTRMSFFVSAAATLHMFSNILVAKQTARSTFDNTTFSDRKTAVFMVCPDEKLNMNPLAALFVDECYRVLTQVANKTNGSLYRRFHFFYDEFSNQSEITGFSQKLTISRGRNILWHLYVQDYSMIEKTYGKEVLNTIKANCNLTIYISTQSFETAEDISKRIGNKTIITQSTSQNSGGSAFITESGSLTKSLMGQPLMDANKLMQLPDGKAIILRMRCHPIYTTIPDCSTYEFYDRLDITKDVPTRDDPDLEPYIPSGYLEEDDENCSLNQNKKV